MGQDLWQDYVHFKYTLQNLPKTILKGLSESTDNKKLIAKELTLKQLAFTKATLEIHYIYLVNKEIYCIFKKRCTMFFIFHKTPFSS